MCTLRARGGIIITYDCALINRSLINIILFLMADSLQVYVFRFYRGDKEISVPLNQVTASRLYQVFDIEESSIWLREEYGGRGFFPEHGCFDSLSVCEGEIYRLSLEGRPVAQQLQREMLTLRPVISPDSAVSGVSTPVFRSVVEQAEKKFTIKVKKATVDNNSKLTPIDVAYYALTEQTANVSSINTFIAEEFGDIYTLIGADGLEIHDQPGTRGEYDIISGYNDSIKDYYYNSNSS